MPPIPIRLYREFRRWKGEVDDRQEPATITDLMLPFGMQACACKDPGHARLEHALRYRGARAAGVQRALQSKHTAPRAELLGPPSDPPNRREPPAESVIEYLLELVIGKNRSEIDQRPRRRRYGDAADHSDVDGIQPGHLMHDNAGQPDPVAAKDRDLDLRPLEQPPHTTRRAKGSHGGRARCQARGYQRLAPRLDPTGDPINPATDPLPPATG
jgi:hypothetical protein